MNLIRFEPWALHRDLLGEFNRHFERGTGWAPAVDIDEYADKFVLHADVPGVDPASIEVTLENGVLTLAGSREARAERDGVESRRLERGTGRFERRFSLPDTVDSESVSASGKHGVIEIVIPKRVQALARKIAVKH